ncbi:MAG: DNA replication/repair protein RecF [Ruminococcaceae bacterium]|nr:DNA replication/repair protein RecF [Oscillospiraceae bacterium]
MRIIELRAEHFRNYDKVFLKPHPSFNILHGANGQGKTNLVEAISLFSNGKSYRTVRDCEAIRFGEERATLNIRFSSRGMEHTGEIIIADKKSASLNGVPISRLSELVGFFNVVVFTPDHLSLIKDGPGVRRQFLDGFLSQIKPVYFKTLMSYYRILHQRNHLLKTRAPSVKDSISVWNETLAQYGSAICDYREKAIREIEKYAAHFTGEITGGKETLSFSYMPGVKGDYHDIDAYIAQLERNFERELEHGMTLVGPHRDDFEPCLSGKSLRRFGSQGQVRTCVIATKLAECEVIKEFMGEYPVLLLDDILSELDEGRRAYLLGNISDKQVFLTCTEPERISNDAAYFKIENGRIIQ